MKFMDWMGPKINVLTLGGMLVGIPPYQCSDGGWGGGNSGAGGTSVSGANPGGATGAEAGDSAGGGSISMSGSGGTPSSGAGGSEATGATAGTDIGGSGGEAGADTGGVSPGGSASGGPTAGGGAGGTQTFPGMSTGYDTSTPEAVKDNHTGLIWQQLPDGDYASLDWETAIAYCSELEHAGFHDWRLPTAFELFGLFRLDNSMTNYHDLTAFPNSPNGDFWSTTEDFSEWPYLVRFDTYVPYTGVSAFLADLPEFEHSVRCVRAGYVTSPRSTELGNGTLLDNQTGLVWEQYLTFNQTYEEATERCSSLDGDAWRLPTVKELAEALTTNYRFDFEIDLDNTANWTSTPRPQSDYPDAKWVIYNYENIPQVELSTPTTGVTRCVREAW